MRFGEKAGVDARQNEFRDQEVRADDDRQRNEGDRNRRALFGAVACIDFRRIEFARRRCEFADGQFIGCGGWLVMRRGFKSFSRPLGPGLCEGEPPHSECKHDQGRNDAQSGRCERRRSEERHRYRVLNSGCAGQCRHCESGCAERNSRWKQAPRHVTGFEQGQPHRCQHEEGHEQTDSAICDKGAGQYDGQCSPRRSQVLRHVVGNGSDRTAIVHQLAEQRSKEKDREELCDETRSGRHERLSPVRQQWLAGERGGNERRAGSKQEDGPSPEGEEHQKGEAGEDSQ